MDINEQLIEIVRSNPCLYDVQVKGYKCRREKEKVWRDIASHFNMSVEQCKSRWKGLRDCYNRCQRMKEQRIRGVGTNHVTKWRYFGAMSFLEDVDVGKRATSTEDSTEKYETEFSEFPPLNDDTMHEETVSSFTTRALNKSTMDLEDSSSHLAELPAESSCSVPDIAVNNRIDANDPIELYFLSLARQIKDTCLPKEIVINIEATISAYIFDKIQEWLKNKDKRQYL